VAAAGVRKKHGNVGAEASGAVKEASGALVNVEASGVVIKAKIKVKSLGIKLYGGRKNSAAASIRVNAYNFMLIILCL
jgi:hypothetical protein